MATAKPVNAPPRPPRRWLRYSLRSFLLLVTAVCVLLGPAFNRARHERLAAEAVEAAGGRVIYNWQVEVHDAGVQPTPPGPEWLRKLVGRHFLDRIAGVEFSILTPNKDRSEFRNALRHLTSLSGIKKLALFDVNITDQDLSMIGQIRPLQNLHVSQPVLIPDAGELVNRQITSEGIAALSVLTNLEYLHIHSIYMDSHALEHLDRLKRLKWLHLESWNINHDDLHHLAALPALTHLQLDASPSLSDKNLAELSQLTSLEFLTLHSDAITNAGLSHLHAFSRLRALLVRSKKIDPKGPDADALRRALPNCGRLMLYN